MKLVDDGQDVHFRLHGAVPWCLGSSPSPAATCSVGTRPALLIAGRHLHYLDRTGSRLADLAALVGPQVRALLKQAAPANKVLAADEEFAGAFAAYLREYGCRTSEELADPSLEERPDLASRFCVTTWTAAWTPWDSKS